MSKAVSDKFFFLVQQTGRVTRVPEYISRAEIRANAAGEASVRVFIDGQLREYGNVVEIWTPHGPQTAESSYACLTSADSRVEHMLKVFPADHH